MHIAFIMGHLKLGGAERVVSLLINQMVERGDCITLINLSHEKTSFYPIPASVNQIDLDAENIATNRLDTLRNVVRRIMLVRQAIKKVDADVLISFTDRTNIIALLANVGMSYPLLISIRAHPTLNGSTLRNLTKLLYPMASAIVSVSRGVDEWFNQIDSLKRYVIGNPVQEAFLHLDTPVEKKQPPFSILSLGRLGREKNHALLIRAFANIADKFPDWSVHIYGSGDEYENLQTLIVSRNVSQQVFVHDPVSDVISVLQEAVIYVQPSDSEGFPNAVLEAMACNLPVIVTDYAGNPRDFITHNETGLIVPVGDETAMTDALNMLMNSSDQRTVLSESAGYVREAFSTEKITQQWYDVIESIIKKG